MIKTDEAIEKLVNAVIEGWDMDTLLEFAKQRLTNEYKEDDTLFQCDVELMGIE